jgi:hypothetical protein
MTEYDRCKRSLRNIQGKTARPKIVRLAAARDVDALGHIAWCLGGSLWPGLTAGNEISKFQVPDVSSCLKDFKSVAHSAIVTS